MAKGYWIPHVEIINREGLQPYLSTADAWHEHNGSRLLVRGGRAEVMEGRIRPRRILREFNSFDEALAAYRSPEYTQARALRTGHAEIDFLIVEGYHGAQPQPIGIPPAPGARKGYWVTHIDVHDPEGYKAYVVADAISFGKFGARFLVRGGRQEVVEGRQRSRTVVLEFPSYQAALDCYGSSEYQAAKALRMGNAELDLIVIEGLGP
ncbi:MAG: DUF1330 domain-containing protein [Xanthobacteraceae bacterium]